MDTKEILDQFEKDIVEMLQYWGKYAGRFYITAENDVVPIDVFKVIRQINERMNTFRNELKILYETYKDMEHEYALEPLSLAYLIRYDKYVNDLNVALNKVKEIASKYSSILEVAKKHQYDVEKYILPKNMKAIERLVDMDLETLLTILADADLLGF